MDGRGSKTGHQASHFIIKNGSITASDDYEPPKPPHLAPKIRKCGLCLGSSPKIEDAQFYGRRADLEEMRIYLEAENRSYLLHCLVLCGMGGVGKTQLALRYAECHRDLYGSVFWLNASSEATLNLSIRSIAECIFEGQEIDNFEDEQIQTAVRQWLSDYNNERWLLIYDNYDSPDDYDIKKYCPHTGVGSIIITTRSPEQIIGHRIRVCPLTDVKEGIAILQTRSGRKDVDTGKSPTAMRFRDIDRILTDKHAYVLVERLAGLPLALATAGSYLKTSPWTFQEYLEKYEKRWNINPRMLPELPEYKDRTLYTTWDISYTRLLEQQPEAAQLLKLLAYFDNQQLWYGHFKAGASDDLPKWIYKMCSDRVEFENLMNILASQCFIEVQVVTQSYSIHTAVHDWMLAMLNREVEPSSYWYAFSCVRLSILDDDFDSLQHLSYSNVAAHARRLTNDYFLQVAVLKAQLEVSYDDAFWVAELLRAQFSLRSAEQLYVRALAGYEKALGQDHASTLNTINNLGVVYRDQGKFDKAETMFLRALAGREKMYGPDHTSTLGTVNDLGNLYRDQGKLDQAEQMLLRALRGKEDVLREDYTSTCDTCISLSALYMDRAVLPAAEKMCLRALTGYSRNLGPVHPTTQHAIAILNKIYGSTRTGHVLGVLHTDIVGIRHYNGKFNIGGSVIGQREADNPYDKYSIRLMNAAGEKIGNIKRSVAQTLATFLDEGKVSIEGILVSKRTLYTCPFMMLAMYRHVPGSDVQHAKQIKDELETALSTLYERSHPRNSSIESLQTSPAQTFNQPYLDASGQVTPYALAEVQRVEKMQTGVLSREEDGRNSGSFIDSGLGASSRLSKVEPLAHTEHESLNRTDKFNEDAMIERIVGSDEDIGSTCATDPRILRVETYLGRRLYECQDLMDIICQLSLNLTVTELKADLTEHLKFFFLDLRAESATKLERLSTELLRNRWARERLADTLIKNLACDGQSEEEDNEPESAENTAEDKYFMLRRFIKEFQDDNDSPQAVPLVGPTSDHQRPTILTSDNPNVALGEDFVLEQLMDDYIVGHEDDLKQLENFMLAGRSFRTLLERLQSQAIKIPYIRLRDRLLNIPEDDVHFGFSTATSWFDKLRSRIELSTTTRWQWWPLGPPEGTPADHLGRVLWRCSCQMQHYIDVPRGEAVKLQQLLLLRRSAGTCQTPPRKRYTSERRGWRCFVRQLIASTNSSLSKWRLLTAAAVESTSATGNGRISTLLPVHLRSNPTSDAVTTPNSTSLAHPPSQSDILHVTNVSTSALPHIQPRYLILGVEQSLKQRGVVLIDLGSRRVRHDSDFISRLKKAYKSSRGFLKLWFSIYQLDTCGFRQFRRHRGRIVLGGPHGCPENHADYEYRAGEAVPPCQYRPPIDEDQFRCDLNLCTDMCWYCINPWHECLLSLENSIVDFVPKKKSDWSVLYARDPEAWGLDCEFAISGLRVILYHAVMVIGTLIFWAWWMNRHRDDMSNAGIPASILLALISAFWQASGVLGARRVEQRSHFPDQ